MGLEFPEDPTFPGMRIPEIPNVHLIPAPVHALRQQLHRAPLLVQLQFQALGFFLPGIWDGKGVDWGSGIPREGGGGEGKSWNSGGKGICGKNPGKNLGTVLGFGGCWDTGQGSSHQSVGGKNTGKKPSGIWEKTGKSHSRNAGKHRETPDPENFENATPSRLFPALGMPAPLCPSVSVPSTAREIFGNFFPGTFFGNSHLQRLGMPGSLVLGSLPVFQLLLQVLEPLEQQLLIQEDLIPLFLVFLERLLEPGNLREKQEFPKIPSRISPENSQNSWKKRV